MDSIGNIANNRLNHYNRGYYQKNNHTGSPTRCFNNQKGIFTPASFNSGIQSTLNTHTNLQKVQKLRLVNNSQYLNDKGELVLPKQILNLIDNKAYINRHKKLAREYGMEYLLKLAELAQTKGKPARWYATVTSVKNWKNQTEAMLIKLFKKLELLAQELAGTGVNVKYLPYYLNAKKRLSEYKFNRCIENARSVGVKKPPNLLASAISSCLKELEVQPTKA